MNKNFGKKGRHAPQSQSRFPYPKLGRYEVNRHPLKRDTNVPLRLGRYEVHRPVTPLPRAAPTLGPYEVQPRRTMHQTIPMPGSYGGHQGLTMHHQQTGPMLGPCEVHPGRTQYHGDPVVGPYTIHPENAMHHQNTPMLGPYEVHPAWTMHHTLPGPMMGTYTPYHPARMSMPRPPASKGHGLENKKTAHWHRKPKYHCSKAKQGKRNAHNQGILSSPNRVKLNARRWEAFGGNEERHPDHFIRNSDIVQDANMPISDTNEATQGENIPPEAAPSSPTPEPKPEPELPVEDILDIDILGPWTEEDERLYKSDLISL